ncbi:hypothetical protein ABE354_23625 [Brevibacillus laterosporus]|uniref:hypothetical protein n=1 Tax=Brevibacillus laterosporus TaxID=1465 RepID=UPI003D1BDDFD
MANVICTSCEKKKVSEAAREYCIKNEYPILCHACQQDKGYNKYEVHSKQEREILTEVHLKDLINKLNEQITNQNFKLYTYEQTISAMNHLQKLTGETNYEYQTVITQWLTEYNKPENQVKIQHAEQFHKEYIRKTKLPRLTNKHKETFYKAVNQDAVQVITKFLTKYKDKPIKEWNKGTVMTEKLLKKRIQQIITNLFPELNPKDEKELLEAGESLWFNEWRENQALNENVPDYNFKSFVNFDNDGVIRFYTAD